MSRGAVREPIDVALWNLITNHANVRGQFVTMGRYLQFFDEIKDGGYPALFIVQKGEHWIKPGQGIPAKRLLRRELIMYDVSQQPTSVYPSSLCNAMMDAIDELIEVPGNPDNVQDLGGLVQHVYLEGDVRISEGFLQGASILEAPITILLP